MPLTDEDFAPTSLDATLAELKKRGYDPLSQADKDKFTADTETRVAGKITKEVLDNVDAAALESGALPKQANEKSSDYVKRVVAHFKSDATGRAQKIADLEKAIAEGAGDKTMQAQLEALQASDADKTEKLTKAEKANFEKDVLLDVRVALLGLRFDPTLKESVRNVMVSQATAKVVGMAATETAADKTVRTVFLDPATQKVLLGEKNQPADAAYLLQKELADVLDAGVQGTGTGSKGGDSAPAKTGKDGKPVAPTAVPADVKTRRQLGDHLLKLGFLAGGKEYDKAMDTLGKDLPIR